MRSRIFAALSIALAATATPVWAGLCGESFISSLLPVHADEARELENEAYSDGSALPDGTLVCPDGSNDCFVGTREYNERVIACNRSRDVDAVRFGPIKDVPIVDKPVGLILDLRLPSERKFADNLPPRYVSGKYEYRGLFEKWYGYVLERKQGNWIVTVTLDFVLPEEEPEKLHIPIEIAERLTQRARGRPLTKTVCAPVSKGPGSDGRIRVERGGELEDRACRVPRNARYFVLPNSGGVFDPALETNRDRSVQEWLMHYWRRTLTTRWSRPDGSFQLKVHIADFVGREGEISAARLERYRRNKVVFKVELHHNETRWNNMYRPVVFGVEIYKAIYAGLDPDVLSHEFGHSLGLGDDYAAKDEPRESKDCDVLSGYRVRNPKAGADDTYFGDFQYVMCVEGDQTTNAKSVYLWLVTQRYSVGKNCFQDDDCQRAEFCDKGLVLGLGVNECKPKRNLGETCSRPKQCKSDVCPVTDLNCGECNDDEDCGDREWCEEGLPLATNICKPKKKLGEGCSRPKQCIPGFCPAIDLVCGECNKDDNCSKSQWCEKGLPGTANICKAKLNDGHGCTRPNQCKSGLCPLPDLKCVECSNDGHCDSSEYCDQGTLTVGLNQCVALKNNGVACSRPKQCKSELCPAPDFKCVECTNDDHCSSSQYCDEGWLAVGLNQCVALKNNGAGCTRKEQCKSKLCNVGFCAECTKDSHCKSDQYCDKGWLTVGKNDCKKEKSQGDGCSRDEQCKSKCCKGFPLKKCKPKGDC